MYNGLFKCYKKYNGGEIPSLRFFLSYVECSTRLIYISSHDVEITIVQASPLDAVVDAGVWHFDDFAETDANLP